MQISNQRRWWEAGATLLTGLAKILIMNIWQQPLVFILLAISGWLTYIIYRASKQVGIIAYWGLTTEGFKRDFTRLLPLATGLILLSILLGWQLGTSVLNLNIIPILLFYPIWGIIQQFLVLGLVARNLKDLEPPFFTTNVVILITALAFGIIHYPYWELIVGTFLMAVVYAWLYLRGTNLIVLGIFHGWLGAFFLYTLLGRDALVELMSKL